MQGRRRCLRDASLELARSEVLEGSLVARLRHLRSLEWFRTFCLCAENEVIEFKPAQGNVCLHDVLAVCICVTFHFLIVWRSMISPCYSVPYYKTARNEAEG